MWCVTASIHQPPGLFPYESERTEGAKSRTNDAMISPGVVYGSDWLHRVCRRSNMKSKVKKLVEWLVEARAHTHKNAPLHSNDMMGVRCWANSGAGVLDG